MEINGEIGHILTTRSSLNASFLILKLFVQQSPTLLLQSQWQSRNVYSVYTQYSVGNQPGQQWGTYFFFFTVSALSSYIE